MHKPVFQSHRRHELRQTLSSIQPEKSWLHRKGGRTIHRFSASSQRIATSSAKTQMLMLPRWLVTTDLKKKCFTLCVVANLGETNFKLGLKLQSIIQLTDGYTSFWAAAVQKYVKQYVNDYLVEQANDYLVKQAYFPLVARAPVLDSG